MRLHRGLADEEGAGDVAVSQALGELGEDVEFAGGRAGRAAPPVAAVGVAGAPSGDLDEKFARAGVSALEK